MNDMIFRIVAGAALTGIVSFGTYLFMQTHDNYRQLEVIRERGKYYLLKTEYYKDRLDEIHSINKRSSNDNGSQCVSK